MYNPFPLFTPDVLNGRIEHGKRYFIRQTYKRGHDLRLKAAFLLRGYEENEKDIAEKHLSKLSLDGNAFLYDALNPEHLKKLEIASRQPFGFKIFYAGKKNIEWKPPKEYQEKTRKYILRNHPNWRTKKGGDKVQVGLYEEFGELFIKLSFEDEEETVSLIEIEKI
jgi:hypothetical protein